MTQSKHAPTQYPVHITEVPHRGKRREWMLYDEKHLQECVEQAYRAGYDGDGTLDSYLEWVGHDLSECHIAAAKGDA